MKVLHSSLRFLPTRRRNGRRGFTLVELLTVLAIIAIVSFSFPAIMSMLPSQTFHGSANELDDCLKTAYSTALARNTYVWVGLTQLPNQDGVGLVCVYSRSGNPDDATELQPLFPPAILKNISLTTISPEQITNGDRVTQGVGQVFSSSNTLNVANGPNTGGFAMQIDGAMRTILANNNQASSAVIEISPAGQISISSNKYAWIELGLQPLHGSAKDVAVLQMNSFTGRVVRFQP